MNLFDETERIMADGYHVRNGRCPIYQKNSWRESCQDKKAFDFLEEMELDDNPDIGNVAEVSVLEALMNDEGGMKRYLEYIGPESLKAARYMSQFYSVEPF